MLCKIKVFTYFLNVRPRSAKKDQQAVELSSFKGAGHGFCCPTIRRESGRCFSWHKLLGLWTKEII